MRKEIVVYAGLTRVTEEQTVYNTQLRNIGRAKSIVCPTNATVGSETALLRITFPRSRVSGGLLFYRY